MASLSRRVSISSVSAPVGGRCQSLIISIMLSWENWRTSQRLIRENPKILIFTSKANPRRDWTDAGISIIGRRMASPRDKRKGCWKRRPERTRITSNMGGELVVSVTWDKVEEETDDAAWIRRGPPLKTLNFATTAPGDPTPESRRTAFLKNRRPTLCQSAITPAAKRRGDRYWITWFALFNIAGGGPRRARRRQLCAAFGGDLCPVLTAAAHGAAGKCRLGRRNSALAEQENS